MSFKLNDYNAFLGSLYDKNEEVPIKQESPIYQIKQEEEYLSSPGNNMSPTFMPPKIKGEEEDFPVNFDFGLVGNNFGYQQEEQQQQQQQQRYQQQQRPQKNYLQQPPPPHQQQPHQQHTQYNQPFDYDGSFQGIGTEFIAEIGANSGIASPPSHSISNIKGRKRSTESPSQAVSYSHKPRAKSAHNIIEQRYRNKINDKFQVLQDSVPTLRILSIKKKKYPNKDFDDSSDDDESFTSDQPTHQPGELIDLEGLEPARKLNKGTILAKSIEYIKFLELKNDRIRNEQNELILRARMMGLDIDEVLR